MYEDAHRKNTISFVTIKLCVRFENFQKYNRRSVEYLYLQNRRFKFLINNNSFSKQKSDSFYYVISKILIKSKLLGRTLTDWEIMPTARGLSTEAPISFLKLLIS